MVRISRSTWNEIGKHVFMVVVAAVLMLPILWIIGSALRSAQDFFQPPHSFFPRRWTLQNFAAVFTEYPQIKDYYLNSIVIAVVVVPITVVISCLAGYGFARLHFPGRNIIFWAMAITMYFPVGIARTFSIYELTDRMGLIDTRLGLILPYLSLGLVVYIFVLRGNFQEIPVELEDAARIDGASAVGVFLRIMVPLARNGIIVVAVLALIRVWGEYILALYLTTQQAVPLAYGLTFMQQSLGVDASFPYIAAVYALSALPMILIFLVLQPWFMKGLMSGALKM
jgi:ABC-type glycerol-3-phosphate transport system permease component